MIGLGVFAVLGVQAAVVHPSVVCFVQSVPVSCLPAKILMCPHSPNPL